MKEGTWDQSVFKEMIYKEEVRGFIPNKTQCRPAKG